MLINTDINILGGLHDLSLIIHYLNEDDNLVMVKEPHYTYTAIKTDKSVKRFEKAIASTFLKFKSQETAFLVRSILHAERISQESLLTLFWNASVNNDLLNYLNSQIYFLAFYSGRISIKRDEVVACLKDLKEKEIELKKWSDSTLKITASKYLTLLKKFHLMEGSINKSIIHPYLNDKMFILFVYWLKSIESKSNLLQSEWLKYSFCEKAVFIERLMQKKFAKYFQLNYTGDKLKIETTVPYEKIYNANK
ncbi:hypothetical protein BH10BAC2_BH10BAC2_02220 [soil metagenome]